VTRLADSGGRPVLVLRGEIDLSTAEAVQSSLEELVDDGAGPVIVDLSSVTFLDSSGLAVLVRLHKRVGSIEVRSPTPLVRRLLAVTGLTDTFGISD
jgi:anti-anti-sigma factor